MDKNVENVQSVQINEDFYLFPECIYEKLPDLIKDLHLEPNNYVSDISLLSLLTSIGSCLPNVFGYYNSERQYPNLYTFIVSPPANYKSAIEIGIPIIRRIHDILYNQSLASKKVFNKLSKEEKGKKDEPYTNIKLLPGATTASKLVKLLLENDHSLIIVETEADSLASQIKSPHGGFSDMLRKIFGNETISKSTMINDRLDYVYKPKLAILISGTPNQVLTLIKSVEDGLYSRFCFLNHLKYEKWKNSSFNEELDKKEVEIGQIISYIEQLHNLLRVNNNAIELTFSNNQQDKFNLELSKIHDLYLEYKPEIIATIRRLGMIHFRICLILSILRNKEQILDTAEFKNETKYKLKIECSDTDFEITLDLIKVLLNHSLSILEMNKSKKDIFKTVQEKIMFSSLPEHFTTDFAIKNSNGYGKDWVKKRLAKWVEFGLLVWFGHGEYKKNL